jgi:DNA-directed RNA polymerase sigma subunit (sigma70/sigma32)
MQATYGVFPKLPELAAKLKLEVSELMTLKMEIEAGKSRLWRSHKKLVFKLAHQYNKKGGLPVADLIMVGSLPWVQCVSRHLQPQCNCP